DGFGSFVDYLKRCNLLLQQGHYVADAAYFIGEDAPKMTGVCDPPLPEGYSFDYINAEILKDHARVVDGRLVLDSGMEYSVLVLPRQETMRPEMLERIYDFVRQGLVIVGPAPLRSPSLQDYGKADLRVKELSSKIWNGSGRCGAGRVYPDGTTMETIFSDLGIAPDFHYEGEAKLSFIHRTLGQDGEIFFVSNQEDTPVEVSALFRVDPSLEAEVWNPVSGKVRGIVKSSSGQVKLNLDRLESAFIVFRRDAAKPSATSGMSRIGMDRTSWKVDFDASAGNPAFSRTFSRLVDWTSEKDPAVRYFSGSALYTNTFTLKEKDVKGAHLTLDLGEAMVIASVKVNGKDAGGAWTFPYRLDIGSLVKEGGNILEIRVWNNWRNRLIADENLPADKRLTWTNIQPWKAGDELQSSGLLGPVEVIVEY
ncbi:MAG: glycoside hydrolase family 2, partial [Bacteroidales bacterium]|nr:glycoside hydrolase family 2 [Bacteroidales bacterium]